MALNKIESGVALRQNRVRRLLSSGDVAIGCSIDDVTTPGVVYTAADAGADFVFIDLEHGCHSLEQVSNLATHAYAAGISALVRVPELTYGLVTPLLDGGCQSLMVPHVTSSSQIDRLRMLTRYAPEGRRGFGMYGNVGVNYRQIGDYAEAADWQNRELVTGVVLEDAEAIERLDDLIDERIDFVMVGKIDLAHSYNLLDQPTNEQVEGAIVAVRAMCASKGVPYAVSVQTPEAAAQAAADGARLVLFSGVLGHLRSRLSAGVSAVR